MLLSYGAHAVTYKTQVWNALWTLRPKMARVLVSNLHRYAVQRHGPPPSDMYHKVVVRASTGRQHFKSV